MPGQRTFLILVLLSIQLLIANHSDSQNTQIHIPPHLATIISSERLYNNCLNIVEVLHCVFLRLLLLIRASNLFLSCCAAHRDLVVHVIKVQTLEPELTNIYIKPVFSLFQFLSCLIQAIFKRGKNISVLSSLDCFMQNRQYSLDLLISDTFRLVDHCLIRLVLRV